MGMFADWVFGRSGGNDIEDADEILNGSKREARQAAKQRASARMQEYESKNWKKHNEDKGKK